MRITVFVFAVIGNVINMPGGFLRRGNVVSTTVFVNFFDMQIYYFLLNNCECQFSAYRVSQAIKL